MQHSKVLSLLLLFGTVSFQLQGCGGGDDDDDDDKETTQEDAEPDTTAEPDTPADPNAPAMVVSAGLTLNGLTDDQAEAIAPAIVGGIIGTMASGGLEVGALLIKQPFVYKHGSRFDDMRRARLLKALLAKIDSLEKSRRLQSCELVFDVFLPEDTDTDVLAAAGSAMGDNAAGIVGAIAAQVDALGLTAALEALGGSMDGVTAVPTAWEVKGVMSSDEMATEYEDFFPAETTSEPAETTSEPGNATAGNETNSSRRLEFSFSTSKIIV